MFLIQKLNIASIMESKNKVFNTTNILLVVLIIIFLGSYFKKEPAPSPAEVTVTIPESSGTSGVRTIEKIIQIPIISREREYLVDKLYYDKYILAKDSLDKLNLYVESIQIKEYKDTLINNDEIIIESYAKTRGSLIEQKIDYIIKAKPFSYKPEYIKERPRLTLLPTLEFGLNRVDLSINFKGGFGFQNKAGDIISLSTDTKGYIYIGYSKSLSILK